MSNGTQKGKGKGAMGEQRGEGGRRTQKEMEELESKNLIVVFCVHTKQAHATKGWRGVVGARETKCEEDNKGPEPKQGWGKKHKQIVEDRNTEQSVFFKKDKHTAWTVYSQADQTGVLGKDRLQTLFEVRVLDKRNRG